jgi:hypothetical protein
MDGHTATADHDYLAQFASALAVSDGILENGEAFKLAVFRKRHCLESSGQRKVSCLLVRSLPEIRLADLADGVDHFVATGWLCATFTPLNPLA